MITFRLRPDDLDGVACTLSDGNVTATASANNPSDALADLATALDRVNTEGVGECYWLRSSGQFRWLFRREADRVRVVVLWSIGTITGWENVFWADDDWNSVQSTLRDQLIHYPQPV